MRNKWIVVGEILRLKSDQGRSNIEVSSYADGGTCIVCDKKMEKRSELKINNYDVHHSCFRLNEWKDDLLRLLNELKAITE